MYKTIDSFICPACKNNAILINGCCSICRSSLQDRIIMPEPKVEISGLEKIEPPLNRVHSSIVNEKLIETIEKVNRIIDYLNHGVKK